MVRCVLILIMAIIPMGCGETRPKTIRWDLSVSHTIYDVAWPPDHDSRAWAIEEPVRVDITYAPGARISGLTRSVLVVRPSSGEREQIDEIDVNFPGVDRDEAVATVLGVLKTHGFDTSELERWRNTNEDGSFQANRNDLDPALSVGIARGVRDLYFPWFRIMW